MVSPANFHKTPDATKTHQRWDQRNMQPHDKHPTQPACYDRQPRQRDCSAVDKQAPGNNHFPKANARKSPTTRTMRATICITTSANKAHAQPPRPLKRPDSPTANSQRIAPTYQLPSKPGWNKRRPSKPKLRAALELSQGGWLRRGRARCRCSRGTFGLRRIATRRPQARSTWGVLAEPTCQPDPWPMHHVCWTTPGGPPAAHGAWRPQRKERQDSVATNFADHV